MKKILGLLVILPIVCLAAGYGAGEFLIKSSHDDASIASAAHGDETHDASADQTGENSHTEETKPIVVKLGQMIIPVYKASSVTYIVTNLGVTVSDMKKAEYYNLGENSVHLRDAIYAQLKLSADGRALRGASIDTAKLSNDIANEVKPNFEGVSDVLFLSFFKRDVAHS